MSETKVTAISISTMILIASLSGIYLNIDDGKVVGIFYNSQPLGDKTFIDYSIDYIDSEGKIQTFSANLTMDTDNYIEEEVREAIAKDVNQRFTFSKIEELKPVSFDSLKEQRMVLEKEREIQKELQIKEVQDNGKLQD